jgi:hypothetical protein
VAEGGEVSIPYPAAGDVGGVHATDFAEYAVLYEQAWTVPGARRTLAHLPSFMIFDDHEVTDDWNADDKWLNVVNTTQDPLRLWPTTMTDALCAYWIYQGWGNLSPEDWRTDERVKILETCRDQGIDALPELRRLVFRRAIDAAARGDSANKLDWHFKVPTGSVPFLSIDLRTDRQAKGNGRMSDKRFNWLEQTLATTTSPLAFIVLPVPFLLPDPIMYIFRKPGSCRSWQGRRRWISSSAARMLNIRPATKCGTRSRKCSRGCRSHRNSGRSSSSRATFTFRATSTASCRDRVAGRGCCSSSLPVSGSVRPRAGRSCWWTPIAGSRTRSSDRRGRTCTRGSASRSAG